MRILTLADVKAIEKQMQGPIPAQALNPIELESRMISRACEVDYDTLLDLPMSKVTEYREQLAEQIQAPVEMVHTESGWEFVMAYPPSETERCIEVRFPTRRDTVQAQSPSTVAFGAKLLAGIAKVDGNRRPMNYWDRISYTDYTKIMEVLWNYGI